MTLTVEPAGSRDSGPCECCGNTSRTVWGYLHRGNRAVAAYYVRWTLGRPDHGASVDLITGSWGPGSSASDRAVVAVAHRLMPEGGQFMVVDATGRPTAGSALAATALRRADVVGTPLAGQVFEMLDAIWLQDARIRELAGLTT